MTHDLTSWKAWILCWAGVFLFLPGMGQQWKGIITDNQATLARLHTQPAAIADMPWKWDVMPLGADFIAVNNGLFESMANIAQDEPLRFLSETDRWLLGGTVQLPSFGLRIGERHGIALQLRMRAFGASATSDNNLFGLLGEGTFEDPELTGTTFQDEFLTGLVHVWGEIGATYGLQIYHRNGHHVQGGITLKLLDGFGAGFINLENASFVVDENNQLSGVTGTLQFIYNSDLDALLNEGTLRFFARTSVGADIGFEYVNRKPNAEGPYHFKLGLSVMDWGKLRYSSSRNSGEYAANFEDIDLNTFENAETLEELADEVSRVLEDVDITRDRFSIQLPTKLGIQADYHIARIYYLNFSAYIALTGGRRDITSTPNFSAYLLTPRMEKPTWSLEVPLYYHELGGFAAGLSGRIGPVFLGVPNLFTAAASNFDDFNAFLGFRFGGRYKAPQENPFNSR